MTGRTWFLLNAILLNDLFGKMLEGRISERQAKEVFEDAIAPISFSKLSLSVAQTQGTIKDMITTGLKFDEMQISYTDNQNKTNSVKINETTLTHESKGIKTVVDSIALNSPNDIEAIIG